MSILVVGSVAFDSVETPFGKADDVLGGSATYFSTAASYFSEVKLVAVVGEDFPDEHVDFLKNKGVDVNGLQRTAGKTFRWQGRYDYDLNEAHTLATHLNVFER
ncbi:MAG: sugar kinase, partial [Deltaproteobacteria bacterium]|nr:sugar kinase [Deltaproteobacteria bacterium]